MLHSGSLKDSKKPVLQKTRGNSGQFCVVLSEEFCAHKILSLKFMQILADDRETFASFLHFLSLIPTIRMYYRNQS